VAYSHEVEQRGSRSNTGNSARPINTSAPRQPDAEYPDISKEAAEGLLAIADFVPGRARQTNSTRKLPREYNEEYDAPQAGL